MDRLQRMWHYGILSTNEIRSQLGFPIADKDYINKSHNPPSIKLMFADVFIHGGLASTYLEVIKLIDLHHPILLNGVPTIDPSQYVLVSNGDILQVGQRCYQLAVKYDYENTSA